MPRDEYDDRDDDRYDDERRDRRSEAKRKVKAPAICLMVTAILGLLLIPLGMALEFSGWNEKQQQKQIQDIENDPNLQPQQKKDIVEMQKKIRETLQPLTYGFWGVLGLCGTLGLVGAIKMKNLSGRGWAYTSAIVSMTPCISIACLLGLPFGIWALVVLANPDVKAAFDQGSRGTRDDDDDRRRDDDDRDR